MVRHGNELIWTWVDGTNRMGVSRVDLEVDEVMTAQIEGPFGTRSSDDIYASGLAADETHAYWGMLDSSLDWNLLRTDHRSGETVVIAHSPELASMSIALSDDYIFVASYGADESGGFIARFSKRSASDGE